MMGPTFSYIAWGCGKNQEEDSEDLSDDQEVGEESLTAGSQCHRHQSHQGGKEHHGPSKKTPADAALLCTKAVQELTTQGEEAAASRTGVDQSVQESEESAEDLSVTKDRPLTTSTTTSACPESWESCDTKPVVCAEPGTSSVDVRGVEDVVDVNSPCLYAEDTGAEKEGKHHREITQSQHISDEQTKCRFETALSQEASSDQQRDCCREESAVIQGSGVHAQTGYQQAESESDKEICICSQTHLNREETCLHIDASPEAKGKSALSQDIGSEAQRASDSDHTTLSQDSSVAGQPDCIIDTSEQSIKAAYEAQETKGSTISYLAATDTQTMATDTVQPMASLQEPGTDPASAEERLSSSESPEPAEETTAGSAKETRGSGTSEGAVAAAEPPGTKPEPDSKTAAVKTKKKEDKSIEYILRALSSLNSPEEKLAALCKKYADLHEEHRVLQTSFKSQQRKMTVGQREKDQLQAEHTKAVMAKSKLESLCRELQKQNKVIKEESILRQKEEEEKRKEISAKFQTTIGEIQTQMTENHEKNVKLREENHDLASKLKKFLEQQELREQQIEKLTKHRELENQLAETKLAHAGAILKEHEEKHLKEKELLLIQTAESQKKNTMLEAQLNMYKERYEEFQGTINKSNDMFQKLKSEMDKMGKRIKKLEKEGAQWRAKWEASNKALLDMAEEKTRSDKEKQLLQTKIIKLESLCRALQGELHGNKSASPQPSSSTVSDSTTAAPAPALQESAVTSSCPASTTATPPNTPEENTSRASPNPDSPASLPPALPTGQNGPMSGASLSVPVPGSSTQEVSEAAGEAECSAAVDQEASSSSSLPASPATQQQQPDAADTALLSSSDQSVAPCQDEAV